MELINRRKQLGHTTELLDWFYYLMEEKEVENWAEDFATDPSAAQDMCFGWGESFFADRGLTIMSEIQFTE